MFGRSKPEMNTRASRSSSRLADLAPRRLVGGRGQGDPRHGGEPLVQHRELQVLRAEIVTPLRYAVRLIDREQRKIDLFEQRQSALSEQAFRSHVEKIEPAAAQPRLDVENLLVG